MALEIAFWLVTNGCQNLILTSRSGIRTKLHMYAVQRLQNLGCSVTVLKNSMSTQDNAEEIFNLVKNNAKISAINSIYLASAILDDGMFTKLDAASFERVYLAKSLPAILIDEYTRKLGDKRTQLIAFSSVSCAFGNAGQTNYGYANSILDEIMTNRRQDGYPGKFFSQYPSYF